MCIYQFFRVMNIIARVDAVKELLLRDSHDSLESATIASSSAQEVDSLAHADHEFLK
jgi:hypothetical protein